MRAFKENRDPSNHPKRLSFKKLSNFAAFFSESGSVRKPRKNTLSKTLPGLGSKIGLKNRKLNSRDPFNVGVDN